MNDPIVEEVRRIRARIAEEHGNDLHRIFEDARRRQGADGRRVISFDQATRGGQSCLVREEPPTQRCAVSRHPAEVLLRN